MREGEGWHALDEAQLEAGTERSFRQRCVEIPYTSGALARLRLSWDGPSRPGHIRIDQMQWFRLSPTGRNDAWLFAGASISSGATHDPERFWTLAHDRFPGADPLILSLAEPGWTTREVLERLPRFLEAHPQLRYVCLDIGGNDIGRDRPWPAGAAALHDALVKLLEMVQQGGRIPILGRFSYRAYRDVPRVPPESNGTGPYVEHVVDPLIARYCPAFYDQERKRGLIDLYGYFRDHPDELSADGVHPSPRGMDSWRRLWMWGAGQVIYGSRTSVAPTLRVGSPSAGPPVAVLGANMR